MKRGRENGIKVLRNSYACDGTFTTSGAIAKTMLLSVITFLSVLFSQYLAFTMNYSSYVTLSWICIIATLIITITAAIKPKYSKGLSIIYCILEGLSLGYVILYAGQYIGYSSVFMALSMVIFVVVVMGALYKTGIIKVTNKFRSVMFTALITLLFGNLIFLLFGLFGINLYSTIGGFSGPISIGLSVISILVASCYVVLDFEFMDHCKIYNAPKYMEWFCALNLMITIIWLFVEILNLLIKLKSDD